MNKASIVIVTYNSSPYIEPCLDSILTQGFKDYEVIVIDNASKDATKSILRAKYPNVVLIENPKNFGTCKARNQGIAKAKGKFILCLDHDVRLVGNFLADIYNTIGSQDNLGAVGPKILMRDGKTVYSRGVRLSYLRRFHDIGSGKTDEAKLEQKKYVFGISAAAAIYRKEALESIKQGGEYFDEDFFYFLEDIDLSWRMQKKGWRILYTPQVECLHSGGRSRNKDKISQYLCMRNRYLLIMKNESLLGFLRLFIVFFVYDLWRNIFMFIINPKYFLKATLEVLKLSPKILKKRRN